MKDTFIPCVKWIKRGVAKSRPEVIQLSKEELKGLVEKAKKDVITNSKSQNTSKKNTVEEESGDNDQFNMEDYDKEDDIQSLIGIGNLISFDDKPENPNGEMEDQEDDDSENEDDEIKATDNLIAVGHVYGDLSVLEMYVFNEEDNDLYVHHDFVLPTIPLALEWLGCAQDKTAPGNWLAVGGITPEITVWDLDVENSLEPLFTLGRFSKKKKHQHRNHGHRDAVLDLSWNEKLPHVLASGSVDRTVLLWDLDKARAVTQFNDFQEKIQTIQWHPSEVNFLITGACDKKVRLIDCRIEELLSSVSVDGEVEKVLWHPVNQFNALIGTSKGLLYYMDYRNEKFLWELKAHNQEITGLAVHSDKPDSLITCSTDQTVKLWSLAENGPLLQYMKNTYLGELQCLQVCPENPNIVCVGGNNKSNNFQVYNLSTELESDSDEMENSDSDDKDNNDSGEGFEPDSEED